MRKINWGVLGTGHIIAKTGPAIQRSNNGIWLGVAGRNAENSRKAAETYGVERAYSSYQELLDDPNIDAVYIALLNHLHMEWAVKAADAGKHILLEKPFTLNMDEARQIKEAVQRNGVQLMEAHAWRFPEAHLAVRQMVQDGKIGELTMVHAHFSFAAGPTSTRLVKEWGGGSLYDIGCYPAAWSRFFMEDEPEEAEAVFTYDRPDGIDLRFAGTLYFSRGRTAQISSSLDMRIGSFYTLMGTHGKIEVRFEATQDVMTIHAYGPGRDDHESWSTGRIEYYTPQAEVLAYSILNGTSVPYGLDDALKNQRVIDALFASGKVGRRVNVSV